MRINTLADLVRWVDSQEFSAADRATAGEDIAGVIHRHAFGQGLVWGDDWGWILEMYGRAELDRIAEESARAHAPKRRRR